MFARLEEGLLWAKACVDQERKSCRTDTCWKRSAGASGKRVNDGFGACPPPPPPQPPLSSQPASSPHRNDSDQLSFSSGRGTPLIRHTFPFYSKLFGEVGAKTGTSGEWSKKDARHANAPPSGVFAVGPPVPLTLDAETTTRVGLTAGAVLALEGMMSGFEISGMSLTSCQAPSVQLQPAPLVALSKRGGWGRKQVSKRSTHARPGMHMQRCPAIQTRLL